MGDDSIPLLYPALAGDWFLRVIDPASKERQCFPPIARKKRWMGHPPGFRAFSLLL
jgi:hypothetical protein